MRILSNSVSRFRRSFEFKRVALLAFLLATSLVCGQSDLDGDFLDDEWERGVGLNALIANDPNADEDGDGVGLLWEFVLGGDPNAADRGILPYLSREDDSVVQLTYRQRLNLFGGAPFVEMSMRLGEGFEPLTSIPGASRLSQEQAGWEEVVWRIEQTRIDSDSGFLRLAFPSPEVPVIIRFPFDELGATLELVQAKGGTATLGSEDLVSSQDGFGVEFGPGSNGIELPVNGVGGANIALDKGSVSLWYRPNYGAADSDDATHPIFTVGPLSNVPHLSLRESDRVGFGVTLSDWTSLFVVGEYRAPVWEAGEWVLLKAEWDTGDPEDSLRLFINGERVGSERIPGGWNLGNAAQLNAMYIGGADGFSADGLIDEFELRGVPGEMGSEPVEPENPVIVDGGVEVEEPTNPGEPPTTTEPPPVSLFPGEPLIVSGLLPNGTLGGELGEAVPASYEPVTLLQIANDRGVRREELADSGIPIPRELNLTRTDQLAIVGPDERRIAAQFEVISRWGGTPNDPSLPIRWLQVSFPAAVESMDASVYALRRYEELPAAEDPYAVRIEERDGRWEIDSGVARFVVDPTNPAILEEVRLRADSGELDPQPTYQHRPGAGPELIAEIGGEPIRFSTAGVGEVRIDSGAVELIQSGPVKAVLAVHGHFVDPSGDRSRFNVGQQSYERFGFTAVMTFVRGQSDVGLQFHVRNEASEAFNPPWDDEAVVIRRACWNVPLAEADTSRTLWAGEGEIQVADSVRVHVSQGRGGGSPWRRQANVEVGDGIMEASEAFDSPWLAAENGVSLTAVQLGWMRYREPQALERDGNWLSMAVVSEPLVVGEGKGLWNLARISFL